MLQTKAAPKHQEEETVVLLSDSDEEEQQDEVEPEEVSALPSVVPSSRIISGGLLGILGTETLLHNYHIGKSGLHILTC